MGVGESKYANTAPDEARRQIDAYFAGALIPSTFLLRHPAFPTRHFPKNPKSPLLKLDTRTSQNNWTQAPARGKRMYRNPIPIIIPAMGFENTTLGSYSGQGIDTKQHLLRLEGIALEISHNDNLFSKRIKTMPKAIRIHDTGGPEVLTREDIEVGDPGDGQVRIKRVASGLNFIDCYQRSGLYPWICQPLLDPKELGSSKPLARAWTNLL